MYSALQGAPVAAVLRKAKLHDLASGNTLGSKNPTVDVGGQRYIFIYLERPTSRARTRKTTDALGLADAREAREHVRDRLRWLSAGVSMNAAQMSRGAVPARVGAVLEARERPRRPRRASYAQVVN